MIKGQWYTVYTPTTHKTWQSTEAFLKTLKPGQYAVRGTAPDCATLPPPEIRPCNQK